MMICTIPIPDRSVEQVIKGINRKLSKRHQQIFQPDAEI